jgi:hypothetical protein
MHVRGFWRADDMTYLVERRFERFLREFRIETQELRRRLMGELESIFELASAIARGDVKTQVLDGRQVRISLSQRKRWARAAAQIAQIIHTIAEGFDEREIEDMLEEARGRAGEPGGEAEEEDEGPTDYQASRALWGGPSYR